MRLGELGQVGLPVGAKRARHGFTLLEMLVILTIICLLAAMMLPVVHRTREQARRAKCLSNLHGLCAAVLLYCVDHDEMFPTPAAGSWQDSDWVYWPGQHSYLGNTPPNPCVGGQVVKYLSPSSSTDMSGALVCPSDDPPRDHALWKTSPYPYSYTINENMARTYIVRGPIYSTLRLRIIKHSEQKILLVDESSATLDDGCWAWQANNAQGKGVNVLSNRHDIDLEESTVHTSDAGHGNVAYCDGHAAYIERRETWLQVNWDPYY